MKKLPTIKEIAAMLDLSVSTVSRALAGGKGISPETTKRVREVAEGIGYEPNRTAVFLRSGRTLTIGVILPHLSEVFFSEAISGIEDYANDHNYNVLVGQSHDDCARERKIVEAMKNHRVDGIVASISKNTVSCDHFDMLNKYEIPVVFFDRIPNKQDVHTISCNLKTGMREALEFLINKEHTRIAFINGPRNLLASKERLAGYESLMKAHNLEVADEYIVYSDLSPESTHRAMQRLLTLNSRPTAVIAFNDYVALDAIKYTRKMNFKINRDISFVSFANLAICNYMESPPLASVEQFPYRQGQLATEVLLNLLNSKTSKMQKDKFQKIVLEPKLVINDMMR